MEVQAFEGLQDHRAPFLPGLARQPFAVAEVRAWLAEAKVVAAPYLPCANYSAIPKSKSANSSTDKAPITSKMSQ